MADKGIAFAGSIIVDSVKMIHEYPTEGMLANISEVSDATGGLVCNSGIDVKILDNSVPVYALGMVGDDQKGKLALDTLNKYGLDTSRVLVTKDAVTGFTDVMTVKSTGERTFFACNGANGKFGIKDIDLDNLNCDIFHAGYILLMDELDREDEHFGTQMAHLLCEVQKRGIKTSIDVVSESGDRFKSKVIPALKYCNYAIMNEIESGEVSGFSPRNSDGSLNVENIKKTAQALLNYGVKDKVVIHSKEAGFILSRDGSFHYDGAVDVPRSMIVGTVGAGDAFCAGALYAIYKGYCDKDILEIAARTAVCSLSSPDAIGGMKPISEVMKYGLEYPKVKI